MCCKWKQLLVWAGLSWRLGAVAAAPQSGAAPAASARGPELELTEENDWVAGTDRHYTQGARVVYLSAEYTQDHWLKEVCALGLRVDAWRWGVEIGQSIFTPENLDAAYPVPNDRPYAGWFYAGPILQRRGATPAAGVPALESLQLQLGVVGPGAMAESEQNAAHYIGGFNQSEGWGNQLRNEPGFALKYLRTWRLAPDGQRDWGAELLPQAGGSLGNVDTSARIGTTVRLGWRMPDDFGVQLIDALGIADGGRPADARRRPFGWYLFFRAEGRAVGYNEFLDGNLFRGSDRQTYAPGIVFEDPPHVDKRPLVFDLQGGLVLAGARLELTFTMDYRTKEFYGQDVEDAFGSVALRAKF